MPPRTIGDLIHDVRVLGLSGMLAGLTSLTTVDGILRILGLNRDPAFRALIGMLLEDTAQAGLEVVPFANAAACIEAYRRGMSRPRGGMQALVEGIGQRFAALGGDLRTATLVDRVEPMNGTVDDLKRTQEVSRGGFVVTTRRGHRLRTRQVALNLPLDLAARLLDQNTCGCSRAARTTVTRGLERVHRLSRDRSLRSP